MGLIWLSYFDPRKDYKTVWWRRGDLTDTRMRCPCCGRGTPRMNRPFKGHLELMLLMLLAQLLSLAIAIKTPLFDFFC